MVTVTRRKLGGALCNGWDTGAGADAWPGNQPDHASVSLGATIRLNAFTAAYVTTLSWKVDCCQAAGQQPSGKALDVAIRETPVQPLAAGLLCAHWYILSRDSSA